MIHRSIIEYFGMSKDKKDFKRKFNIFYGEECEDEWIPEGVIDGIGDDKFYG